jgi:hypothetical protein
MEEERTTLLTLKLIVLISFQLTRREKHVGQVEQPEIKSENMELEPVLDSAFCHIDQPEEVI